jgi:nucleotide-binding universal stress UspA family protein
MVLGDVAHPAHHRLITGSVIGPIAAHSPTPVVVVPANCAAEPRRDVVVAGVKSVAVSRGLVRQAFEVAAGRGARLVLLHAWQYSAPAEDLAGEQDDLAAWEERSAKELRQVVDEVARDFPGVEAEVRLVRGQPAKVLVDASADADLLAITRRPHGFPFGHLGGTGRAVLRETRCPAIVLPPSVRAVP